jgi:aryl-alcohol dehydrogenase-like predicted oxidoreductase
MNKRRLGRTGLQVSEIGFGCGPTARLMVHGSGEEQRRAVDTALRLGINYFDTAPGYGDTASETNLGRALRTLNARPIVASKVTLQPSDFGDIAGAVVRSVEDSLVRLGLPNLPLIQLHNRVAARRADKAEFGSGALLAVQDVLGPGGVLEGFDALRSRGLVSHYGCSAFGGEMPAVRRIIESGRFDAMIVHYSIRNPSAFDTQPAVISHDYAGVAALAAASGMGVIALRVLEGGALAGSPAGGMPDIEGAIRFALSNPRVATAIIGLSDERQVEEAVSYAARGPLEAAAAGARQERA